MDPFIASNMVNGTLPEILRSNIKQASKRPVPPPRVRRFRFRRPYYAGQLRHQWTADRPPPAHRQPPPRPVSNWVGTGRKSLPRATLISLLAPFASDTVCSKLQQHGYHGKQHRVAGEVVCLWVQHHNSLGIVAKYFVHFIR